MAQTNVLASKQSSLAQGFFGRCQCNTKHRARKSGCKSISTSDAVDKPDLAIYSQQEEVQAGRVPSWDSPDITTNHWGPFRLMPEAKVRLRNTSASVPAINALVHYFTSPFGIGMRRELKLTKVVNVAPNAELSLAFPLDQSTLQGDPRVGVYILLEHPHDEVMINNEGAQVHDGGYTSESGRTFSVKVPVLNDSSMTREITLSIMPTDLIASVSPSTHVFSAHEQIVANVEVEIPAFLTGTSSAYLSRSVTVVGRLSSGDLVGGVTRLVRIDN